MILKTFQTILSVLTAIQERCIFEEGVWYALSSKGGPVEKGVKELVVL